MKKKLFLMLSLLLISLITLSCNKTEEIKKNESENEVVSEEVGKNKGKKEIPEIVQKEEEKEVSSEKKKPKVTVTEGEKNIEEEYGEHRIQFIEDKIMMYSEEGDIFAIVDAIYEEDLEYFNITEEFDAYEDDFYANNIILPLTEIIHIKAEKVEYDEVKEDFKAVETLWENEIMMYSSNFIRTPLVEGAPSLRLTVTGDGKTIYWYNTFNGKDGNGIHYYFEDGEPSRFLEFNPEALATDEITDAYLRLIEYDEVSYHMENGMEIYFDNNYEEINGVNCPVFVLGTDHEEHFVVEFRYAYDSENDQVYTYNVEEDQWEVLGYG